jgi:transcriptional regulator with XRE-family HTH domain
MTPLQLRAALKRLKMSQRAFAKLVRVNRRTVTRWAAGDTPIPSMIRLLLEAWTREGCAPAEYNPKRPGRPPN